jgi:hypothetical protein
MLVEPQTGATGDKADGQHEGTTLLSWLGESVYIESIQKFKDVSDKQETFQTYDKKGNEWGKMTEYTAKRETEFIEAVEDDITETTTLDTQKEKGGENIGIDYFEEARKGANLSEKKVVLLTTTGGK